MPPNGPELSCGDEVPQQRNPVRAWYVQSDCSWLFRASKIVDGTFRLSVSAVGAMAYSATRETGYPAHIG